MGLTIGRKSSRVAAGLLASVVAMFTQGSLEARAAERPLVYVVVIDGLDGDGVDRGEAPFVSSLLAGNGAQATYYRESRSVMVAETNPNHAAMMSGAYAGASGIAGNAFAIYAPTENEDSCAATGPLDESRLPTPVSGENANCPSAEFVFEALRRQGNPDGLVTAAIFGKAKLGRIFAGRNVDPSRRDVDHLWAPCVDGSDDDDYCGNVPVEPVQRDRTISDSLVMDEVLRTIRQGVETDRGRARPDFTFINLPNVDNAGHAFGGTTAAYSAAVGLADAEVGRLVTELRRRGDWQRTVLLLLSDHAHDTTLTKTNLQGAFTDAGIEARDFLVVQNGSVDMAYLADRTSPGRFELLKRMRSAALATGNVAEALYREPNPLDGGPANTIDGVHPGWRAAGPRTGDLYVVHRPGGAFSDPSETSNPLLGGHGAPTTRDNFFAIAGGGDFVRQQELRDAQAPGFDDTLANPRQAENVDVAPTVMGLFGLFEPEDNAGRFLAEAIDRSALPGKAAPANAPDLELGSRPRRGGQVSYRLSWTPPGGLYDLQVRSGGRWRTLLRRSPKLSRSMRGRTDRRYRFRVRSRSASGVHSAWRERVAGGTG